MRGTSLLLAVALPVAAAEAPPADPRAELRLLEVALSRAADRVARPNVFALNEAECRGYRIAGVGAVFVLPPRALRSRSLLVWRVPEPPASRTPRASRDPRIRVVERQAVELQREAERTHAEVERAIDAMRRQIERRRAVEMRAAGIALPEPPSTPQAPEPPSTPAPPSPAEAPEAPLPPPPPWALWVEAGEGLESEAPAESVVPRMRASLIEVLTEHGLLLQGLRPEETIAAAVDFVPSFPFGGSQPEKTLVLRVRKKDLEERRSGKISPDQLRTRIEAVEY